MTAPRIEQAPFSDGAWWVKTPGYMDHWEPVFLEPPGPPVWIPGSVWDDATEYMIVSSWGNYEPKTRVGYTGSVLVDGKWIDAMWAKLAEPEE